MAHGISLKGSKGQTGVGKVIRKPSSGSPFRPLMSGEDTDPEGP